MEFLRQKETYFDRCNSSEVGNNYKKLKHLILIEEFKNSLSDQLKLYLEEKRFETA